MKIFIGPEAANCALDTQATIKRKKATESKEGLGGGVKKKTEMKKRMERESKRKKRVTGPADSTLLSVVEHRHNNSTGIF